MDDETKTRVPRPSGDGVALDDDETAKPPQEYTAEEVAQELLDFLSRLSPFRIHPSPSDDRSPGSSG